MLRDRLSVRRLRRQVDFTNGLVHEVVVPPGPDGRPGERLLAPSRSFYVPSVTSDDSRYGAGLVCLPLDSEQHAVDRARAVLATWRWHSKQTS